MAEQLMSVTQHWYDTSIQKNVAV